MKITGTHGAPAIKPHINLDAAGASANLPTYTAEDAIAYVTEAGPGALAPITVGSVSFVSDAEATKLLHRDPGLSSGALICIVVVHGRFQLHGPSGFMPPIVNTVYEIFDGRTGNMIGSHVPNDPRVVVQKGYQLKS